jgi:hypothetical protein
VSSAGSINYGALEDLIQNVATSALRAGIAPGTLGGIHIDENIVHTALTLGLM